MIQHECMQHKIDHEKTRKKLSDQIQQFFEHDSGLSWKKWKKVVLLEHEGSLSEIAYLMELRKCVK